jgi:predicted dehydrogenase
MVKWCIIGGGGIADRRAIPAILKDEGSMLCAIMERVPKRCEELAKKYGVPCFTDTREMLSAVECDAVYIGTPLGCHAEDMLCCLEFSKHVFIEKPFTMNADEGRRIADMFIERDLQLTVGYMMKYHNLHKKAKEIISRGGIGRVNFVSARFSCWYPETEGAWRQKRSLGGGGAVMDLGVHCLELCEEILGERIVEIKALLGNQTFGYEVEDGGAVIFRTEGGTLGTMIASFNVPDAASESAFELYGTKGYLKAQGTLSQEEAGTLSYLYSPQGEYNAEQGATFAAPEIYAAGGEDIYKKQIVDFRETIERGEREREFLERAIRVQELIDAIYRVK